MFGNPNSGRNRQYIKWGLKRRTNALARQHYQIEADQVLLELGLSLPTVDDKLRHASTT